MGNFSVCHGCNERQVGCHSTCERYRADKMEREQKSKDIRAYFAGDNDVCGYERERVRKIARRLNREHK